MPPNRTAKIYLWGKLVGAVAWMEDRGHAAYEFDPAFLKKGWDISPLHLGIESAAGQIFTFPALNKVTYMGLPGFLADVLPDKFGNAIIDAWLARQGSGVQSFGPVERLCYTGKRGMGALEFAPPINHNLNKAVPVEIEALVSLAQDVMHTREKLDITLGDNEAANAEAMLDILRVGTSAGGARPKAIIAMNDKGRVISGQTDVPQGYEHWLLKFDGVTDLELGEPKEFGRIEFAYHLMAQAAGIEMTECRLLEETGRAHFMTKRFDRDGRKKIHMQTLCGIAHYDFNMAGAYGYEQAFQVMRRLRLPKSDAIQLFRRMVFNVLARNQDDHTKNISFLMDQTGTWRLSPAYDVTYAHNPAGKWTNTHQMSINGKLDGFTIEDMAIIGESIRLSNPKAIVSEIAGTVDRWPEFAKQAGLRTDLAIMIGQNHRKLSPR
ncbi:type II toxin-antitoxin system HipA family toxin [Geobacter argillaceus]|uniref:Serine/threonine-protein kinase HipA n=1 Tax=Geobacter argillaceus TaxID=345631 RepID=A0A562WS57_9BACT|nr:type II toxin-antitoxin system HipA family toxin [Geobacter argillaceus]TWJ33424.1 serine/threonine-protein kinase HipA [Geobacter argillaceus]